MRSAVLALLSEEPMHGYQMIQEIGRRSGGRWRPSPGSVYPTLQQLEDEQLVRAEERDGRRVYELTDEGRAHVADRTAEFADLWEGMAPPRPDNRDENGSDMGTVIFGVAAAFLHVLRTGSAHQIAQARAALARTRSELYRILGDADGAEAGEPGSDVGDHRDRSDDRSDDEIDFDDDDSDAADLDVEDRSINVDDDDADGPTA